MDDSHPNDRSVEPARGGDGAPGLSGSYDAESSLEMEQVEDFDHTEDDAASLSTYNGTDR